MAAAQAGPRVSVYFADKAMTIAESGPGGSWRAGGCPTAEPGLHFPHPALSHILPAGRKLCAASPEYLLPFESS